MNNYSQERLEANKKAIGKTYWVLGRKSAYLAEIKEVLEQDCDYFLVQDEMGNFRHVNIFDLRSVDQNSSLILE